VDSEERIMDRIKRNSFRTDLKSHYLLLGKSLDRCMSFTKTRDFNRPETQSRAVSRG